MSDAPQHDPAKSRKLAELFYEDETQYYGVPPFAFLDEIGEVVVEEVLKMIERSPDSLGRQVDFLSAAQIELVRLPVSWDCRT